MPRPSNLVVAEQQERWKVEIARLARRQHRAATWAQLRDAGLSVQQLRTWSSAGHLRAEHRGVYALGLGPLTDLGRLMAAVLAAGPGACLSHLAAAFVHSLIARALDPIDVTTPSWRKPRPKLTLHTRRLDPTEITLRHGIPTTTPERTLLDLAAVLPGPRLRRTVHQAEVERTTTHAKLVAFLADHAGSAGAPRLRRLLAPGPAPTRSELEDRLLELLDDAPPHEPNAHAEGYEVDILFRAHDVIVEADGARFHGPPLARAADAAKQARLEAAGFRVLRVTWDDVTRRPEQTKARIARALAR